MAVRILWSLSQWRDCMEEGADALRATLAAGVLRMKRLLAFYLNRHRVRSYGGCPIDTRDNTPLGSEIVVVLTGRVTR